MPSVSGCSGVYGVEGIYKVEVVFKVEQSVWFRVSENGGVFVQVWIFYAIKSPPTTTGRVLSIYGYRLSKKISFCARLSVPAGAYIFTIWYWCSKIKSLIVSILPCKSLFIFSIQTLGEFTRNATPAVFSFFILE